MTIPYSLKNFESKYFKQVNGNLANLKRKQFHPLRLQLRMSEYIYLCCTNTCSLVSPQSIN